jgi:hypothetical protein
LDRIGMDRGQMFGNTGFLFNHVFVQSSADETEAFGYDSANIRWREIRYSGATKLKHVLNELGTPFRFLMDDFEYLKVGIGSTRITQQIFRETYDDTQRIVKLMGHRGGYFSNRNQSP